MVCTKCAKATAPTSLATPGVKKKAEVYYGSPASAGSSKSGAKSSPTIGNTGIGKSKLLSKSAKNPYAAYSNTCTGKECATKIEAGRKYCQKMCLQSKRMCDLWKGEFEIDECSSGYIGAEVYLEMKSKPNS